MAKAALYPLQKQNFSAIFVVIQRPMKLMMYIGNDLIEAVPLDREQVPVPGYLGKIKRNLKEKYKSLIAESQEGPEFLVINSITETKQTNFN